MDRRSRLPLADGTLDRYSEGRTVNGTRLISLCFVVSAASSLGLAFVYLVGGQPQLEGLLLGISLGGIGVGLIAIAKRFLPEGPFVQERKVSFDSAAIDDAADTVDEGA